MYWIYDHSWKGFYIEFFRKGSGVVSIVIDVIPIKLVISILEVSLHLFEKFFKFAF